MFRSLTVSLLVLTSFLLAAAGQAAGPPEIIKPIRTPRQVGEQFRAQLVQASSLIRASQARAAYNVNGAGLAAAVLDTGIFPTHQDFTGRLVAQRNFTADNGGNVNDALDGDGHGTHVSGIVLANGPHIGIATGANLVGVKVLDNTGSGSFNAVRDALDYVLANHVALNITVVNMSLGDGGNYTNVAADLIQQKIQALRDAKVAVCAAAGNDFFEHSSVQGMGYPTIFPETVSVGAVFDANIGQQNYGGPIAFTSGPNRLVPFSQRLHPNVNATTRTDIFAPGADITSAGITSPTSSAIQAGTSQATPMVAGVVLLLQQYWLREQGTLPTIDQLVTWLRVGSVAIHDGDDEDDNVTNTNLGFLRVDALSALQAAEASLASFSVSGTVTFGGAGLSGVTVSLGGGKQAVTNGTGQYSITGLLPGMYTATPTRPGYVFTPGSLPVTVGPNATGVDFTAVGAHSVSGTVTLGGMGLAGVTVGNGTFSTQTQMDGTYVLTGLTPGTQTITPSNVFYTFAAPSQDVIVGPDQTGIDFAATPVPLYSIQGTVTFNGAGLPGVNIAAGGQNVSTDGNGDYTVSGLVAGNYSVTPTLAGYVFAPPNRNVILGPDATAVDFAASGIFSISGRLRWNGAPVSGVELSNGITTTTSDVNGDYVFGGLTPGEYTIGPISPGYEFVPNSRTVAIDANRTGIDYTAIRLLIISGIVTDGSDPIEGVTVQAGPASTVTGPGGTYVLSDLPPGNYTVTPTKSGFSFGPSSRILILATEDRSDIDFVGTQGPVLTSLTLSAASVKSKKSVKGTVNFSSLLGSARTVVLSSSSPASLTIPASVNVGAGKQKATFTIKAKQVAAPISVTVTATSNGVVRNIQLQVNP